MTKTAYTTGGRSEVFYLLLVAAPLVVVIALLAFDGLRQISAASELRQMIQTHEAQGNPIDNNSLSEQFAERTSAAETATWDEILSATRALSRNVERDLGNHRDPHNPQEFATGVKPADIQRMQRAAPIFDAIDRLVQNDKPIWTTTIFVGYETLLPQLQNARSVSRLLADEFQVAVSLDDRPRAMRALRLLNQVARVSQQDMCAIGCLVTQALDGIHRQMIQFSLASGFWEDAQYLNEIQQQLSAPIDLNARWRLAIQGEQAMVSQHLGLRDGHPQDIPDLELSRLFPFGIAPTFRIELLAAYDELIKFDGVGTRRQIDAGDAWEDRYMKHQASVISWSSIPFATPQILWNLTMPAVHQLADSIARDARERRWTRVACAIKQFQLQTGHWPEQLSQLGSQGLTEADWSAFEGIPFGYQVGRNEKVAYLWSNVAGSWTVSASRPVPADGQRDSAINHAIEIR